MSKHISGCVGCARGDHLEHIRLRAQLGFNYVAEVIHVRGTGKARRGEYLWLGNARGDRILIVNGPKQIDALRRALRGSDV